ncbi:MAG: glycosyltransferase, partial [Gemmatimonadetes bacterium]|nr:glycosyltransferase [Gemmatimonadota bacterium]
HLPRVTVQLPVYNEKHVIERLIDTTCRLSHPRHLLQIQVLDDSTDDTTALARRRAREWREEGVDITVLHRTDRHGYKAGALAAGLKSATGDQILILDADFVPPPGLLEDLLPSMDDPRVGMVQARWDHLNEDESWLTRAQALLLDGHFLVEQRGRYRGGRLFKFNGTAGLWRRKALEEAGGWHHDTLIEDLDISYRSQMAGWRFVLRDEVGVPAELPRTPAALLVQQRRWAQGGVQAARKLLPRVLGSSLRPVVKLEGVVHLCGQFAYPLTFALALLVVPAAFARRELGMDALWWLDLALFAGAAGPFIAYYLTAARRRGRPWGRATWRATGALVLGAGLSALLTRSVFRGFRRVRDPFERTPKTGEGRRPRDDPPARGAARGRAVGIAAGAYMVLTGVVALSAGFWASLPFVALFAAGFLSLGVGGGGARRGEAPEDQSPHRQPHGRAVPAGLRPDPGGLVAGKSPVAEEGEAAREEEGSMAPQRGHREDPEDVPGVNGGRQQQSGTEDPQERPLDGESPPGGVSGDRQHQQGNGHPGPDGISRQVQNQGEGPLIGRPVPRIGAKTRGERGDTGSREGEVENRAHGDERDEGA